MFTDQNHGRCPIGIHPFKNLFILVHDSHFTIIPNCDTLAKRIWFSENDLMTTPKSNSYDFVIIGSGSAGSVLADRLSAQANHTVLVLEYGGSDRGPLIQMPSALSYPMNMGTYNWGFESEPEPFLNNRKLATPRGKVMGGSSSINGMVYVRGHARD